MIRSVRACGTVLLLAGLVLAGLPATVQAAKLIYRNDTKGPVIVQGFGVVRGVVITGKRHVLQPGDTASDNIVAPGNKLIKVFDAQKPTQELGSQTIFCTGLADLSYAIEINTEKPKNKPVPKVKLVQEALPMGAAGPSRR